MQTDFFFLLETVTGASDRYVQSKDIVFCLPDMEAMEEEFNDSLNSVSSGPHLSILDPKLKK